MHCWKLETPAEKKETKVDLAILNTKLELFTKTR